MPSSLKRQLQQLEQQMHNNQQAMRSLIQHWLNPTVLETQLADGAQGISLRKLDHLQRLPRTIQHLLMQNQRLERQWAQIQLEHLGLTLEQPYGK